MNAPKILMLLTFGAAVHIRAASDQESSQIDLIKCGGPLSGVALNAILLS
jgi:hypothetical protein